MDKDMEALSLWSASSSSVVGSLVRRAFNPNHRHGLRVALGAYYQGVLRFRQKGKESGCFEMGAYITADEPKGLRYPHGPVVQRTCG